MDYDTATYDWRLRGYARLSHDVPATPYGAPSHRAGTAIVSCTLTRNSRGKLIGFARPRAATLALSVAINSAHQAASLHKGLEFESTVTPYGSGQDVAHSSTSNLFDYFQHCMVSVTFSYQAIESFCNEIVSEKVTGTFPLAPKKQKKKIRHYSAAELQGEVSVERKLRSVLPQLFGVPSPENEQMWTGFSALQRVRNTLIHLKSNDEYKQKVDKESLFFEFFRTEPFQYPHAATCILEYFKDHCQGTEWIENARRQLEEYDLVNSNGREVISCITSTVN